MPLHGRTCRERNAGHPGALDIGLVVSSAERDACFRLVHDQYVERGYAAGDRSGRRVLVHQALPTTTMFRATTAAAVVGTVTLVADSVLGLPMDSLYAEELRPLRAAGRRVAEVSALAVAPGTPMTAIVRLMSRLVLYAEALARVDDLCVTVHPRHARFYERLGFARMGAVKPYAAVNGAPAVAFRLDLGSALAARASRAACARRFVVDAARAAILTRLREEQPQAVLTPAEFVRFFVGQRALADAPPRTRAVLQSFHSDVRLENVEVAGKEAITVLGSA
jgi:hypothetical protein